VLALILLFELPKGKKLQREIDVLQQLHNKEKEQYFISKENIELINIKCHDLRHQIRTIGQSSALDETAVAEIAKLVDVYDSTYKTECEALNVILMEKSLLCKKDEIDFSCIIDGTKLGFVKDTDVYALFGNLLDNAIEAVRSLKKEERTIGVVVKTQNGIISLNVYNSFKGKIKYDGGLPVTTKKEKAHHGFGLKSVRNIVASYGGQMQIATGNGVFDVRIVLPIKE
jgi:nitrogen fixation/metabolism regulation signal transduction histidine kinase